MRRGTLCASFGPVKPGKWSEKTLVQAFEGNTYGVTPDLVTAEATTEDTWTDGYFLPGGDGAFVNIPITMKITGAAVVTVQVRRPGESWAEAHDLGDTAGSANDTKILPVSGVTWFGGWYLRAGVKTGALGGGSAVITIGTRAE